MYYTLDDIKYNYDFGMTREKFLKAMRTNDASDLFDVDKNGDCWVKEYGAVSFAGLFVCELPYIDLELELAATYNKEEKTIKPFIYYDINIKTGNLMCDWVYYECLNDVLSDEESKYKVDFNAADWDQQMEKDMKQKLLSYCKARGYDYLHPITF